MNWGLWKQRLCWHYWYKSPLQLQALNGDGRAVTYICQKCNKNLVVNTGDKHPRKTHETIR